MNSAQRAKRREKTQSFRAYFRHTHGTLYDVYAIDISCHIHHMCYAIAIRSRVPNQRNRLSHRIVLGLQPIHADRTLLATCACRLGPEWPLLDLTQADAEVSIGPTVSRLKCGFLHSTHRVGVMQLENQVNMAASHGSKARVLEDP